MGFALWLDDEFAWAQGTHEYRPMGAAVIARTSLFRARDFSPTRSAPQYFKSYVAYLLRCRT